MSLWKKKIFFAPLFAFLIAIILIIVVIQKPFVPLQLQFADQLYTNNQPSKDIIVIAMDEKTLDPVNGLGPFEKWNRSYYAQVINNLSKYHPKVIGIDVLLRTIKDRENDQKLADALMAATQPVIIFLSNFQSNLEKGYFVHKKNVEVLTPIDLYRNISNVTLGLNNVLNDPDKVIRRFIPAVYDEDIVKFNETFAFAIARKVFNGSTLETKLNISPSHYEMNLGKGKKINVPLEEGQMLVNFHFLTNKRAESYHKISFVDVYNEKYQFDPTVFKNKIILIGPTSDFFRDNFFTPGGYLMPGVEIHANAIQTILDQQFLRNMSLAERSALLIFLCLAAAFVFMYSKIRWSVLFLIGVTTLYTFATPWAFQHGLILDLIHPYLALIAVFMAIYIYRYLTEFKDKLALKAAFNKYVSPALVDQIAKHPEQLKLGGDKREITVLFTDIVHFTSMAEKLSPENLVTLLNQYFDAMSEVILAEGGTLDKFEGDAIMAFFGAPLLQNDHAIRACRAALKMRQRLQVLNQKLQNTEAGRAELQQNENGGKHPPLDFRVGLSTGEVIVGNVGSSSRFNYTVMGDTVNLGSRLEGANKKYETHAMVSEKTFLATKDQFEFRELDMLQVVGKSEPIKVYELLAQKGQLQPEVIHLLDLYTEGIRLYHERKFAEALAKFDEILKVYPDDGPSKLYRQRCEVLRDFPPAADWDGVFKMETK